MLHRSPTLSILHDMLQPNGLADSHHSFDHRERLWCAATAAPTASTRGRPAGRQQPRVMLLADVEIAGDVEIQPQWQVLQYVHVRTAGTEYNCADLILL